MTLALIEDEVTTDSDFSICHLFCCDENVALCGLNITDWPEADDEEEECVVCVDIADYWESIGGRDYCECHKS